MVAAADVVTAAAPFPAKSKAVAKAVKLGSVSVLASDWLLDTPPCNTLVMRPLALVSLPRPKAVSA